MPLPPPLAPDDPLLPGDTRRPPQAMLDHWAGRLDGRREPLEFWTHVGLGRRGDGLLNVPDPEWLIPVLDEWLGGPSAARTPLGYTGLGDIFYFRDLRARARALGLDAETVATACDVSVLVTRHKRVQVLAHSMAAFVEMLSDPEVWEVQLGASLFREGLGPHEALGPTHILGFVPALALGGAETADHLAAVSALEHWSILLQA